MSDWEWSLNLLYGWTKILLVLCFSSSIFSFYTNVVFEIYDIKIKKLEKHKEAKFVINETVIGHIEFIKGYKALCIN